MGKGKLLVRLLRRPKNFSFADALKIAEAFGFLVVRLNGSHHILKRSGIPELINLQDVGGQARPYQLRQLLELIERYDLTMGDSQ
ncbi:MAG: type II toxin-antitoxin system HicA family toxin [Candidatus Riflebacteria bacterium]|nr:type II toxin-antitoxin system HicA family toxin [Candidatus Riflebacteria bacterium]